MKKVFATPTDLAFAAAQSFQALALEAITARGRFDVALAGGSTPKIIYQTLTTFELPWQQIHIFWGDERCVPPTDARSNYLMVQQALLEKILIPPANVHRMQGELEPAMAVQAYQQQLPIKQFDLIHLGLGTDGHTASLFPASPLEISDSVLSTFPTPNLEPQVPRISLGFSVINAARVKQIFVTGENKRPIFERLGNNEDLPIARVINAEWWFDQAAAID